MSDLQDLCADLLKLADVPNAEDRAIKMEAVVEINLALAQSGLSKAELARRLGWSEPRICDLTKARLDRFSIKALNQVLEVFGYRIASHYSLDKIQPTMAAE